MKFIGDMLSLRKAHTVLVGAVFFLGSSNVLAQAPVKTAKAVSVVDFQIRVSDEVAVDWSSSTGFEKVAHPQKRSGSPLAATDDQRLQLSFQLVDASTKTSVQPQQVFIRLASEKREVILLPEATSDKVYRLDVDFKAKAAKAFDNFSGRYELSLIVGDAAIKSFMWTVGDVDLSFSQNPSQTAVAAEDYFVPLPEIVHMFRQPEKRPPVFVSNVFSIAIMSLFGLMLVLWARIGLSFNGLSASSLLFQASLGAILYIEYLFYLGEFNMFTTLRYLSWASPFALYFGRRMLSNLAKNEESASKH